MGRRPGYKSPSDYNQIVKLPPVVFDKLGEVAAAHGTTRPKLAILILAFMLNSPEVIDAIFLDKKDD